MPLLGNDFVMPARTDPWVLGTFTQREVVASGTSPAATGKRRNVRPRRFWAPASSSTEVENTPAEILAGRDPQLEKALEVVLGEIDGSELLPGPPASVIKTQ